MAGFKAGKIRVLVASDIASRGLDVDDISHVINFEIPDEPEVYVHRIGRTARAGATGIAWSFCGLGERPLLDAVERLTNSRIETLTDHPYASPLPRQPARKPAEAMSRRWSQMMRRSRRGPKRRR